MRTTFRLDEDLAERLKKLAAQEGQSSKTVANEVIRRGLSAGEPQHSGIQPFRVEPKARGLRPGVDLLELNQLSDDLEI